MMKNTHLVIGLAISIPLIVREPISAWGLLGAIAPDWDFYLGLKHRTITHSLLSLVLTTATIRLLEPHIALGWFICYISHLIADSFTIMGTPFLYPFNKKYYGLRNIRTRSVEDYTIQFLTILLMFWIYLM